MRTTRLSLAPLVAATLLAGSAFACQVPVFRYALERWIPDDHRLESAAIPEKNEHTNLTHSPSSGDALTLHYPKSTGIAEPFFTAPSSAAALAAIPDSPLRREILRRILKGNSAVWLLVESGDAKKDEAAFATVAATLQKAESTLELPEGIVGAEEARLRDVSPEEEENVLVSTIPLEISFSVLRVSRNNPEEAVLLSLLLNMEDDLGDFAADPITFTIFGRGRVLPPLIAGGITADNILADCAYLCGACSCQVKRENPGIDALFTADWDAALEGGTVVIDKILPPLTGAGGIVAAAPPNTDTKSPAPIAPPLNLADSSYRSTFPLTVLLAIGAAVLLILFASIRILKRSQ